MVQLNRSWAVRAYTRKDQTPVNDLAFFNQRVHVHLDWQTIQQYLQAGPSHLWVAYRDKVLMAAMGVSEPINGHCWIRFIGLHNDVDAGDALLALWETAAAELRQAGANCVLAMVLQDWLYRWVRQAGFTYLEDIITLIYRGQGMPLSPPGEGPSLQPVTRASIAQVHHIDQHAFDDPWRMTQNEIRLGLRASAYFQLAHIGDTPVGYQLSTIHSANGHLARLGVLPGQQGRGLGSWLVYDMIRYFHQRGIDTITVNTQASNERSKRVYERFGFSRNGYDLPVWQLEF